MKLEVSSTGPPEGTYSASFAGVEQCQHSEFGQGLRWKFFVVQGDHAGQVASRVTGVKPSRENACGRVLSSLLGRELTIGEHVELEDFVGRTYLVTVAPAKNGGTRVESIVPVSETLPSAAS